MAKKSSRLAASRVADVATDPRLSGAAHSIAELYDPWSRSVVEDVAFYVEEARSAGGPVVELGVGTGRIAIPTVAAGIHVIGVEPDTANDTYLSLRKGERVTIPLSFSDRLPVKCSVCLSCGFVAPYLARAELERLRAHRDNPSGT